MSADVPGAQSVTATIAQRRTQGWAALALAAAMIFLGVSPGAWAARRDAEAVMPRNTQPSTADDQPYSYYYVPRLGGLNQVVGALLRNVGLRTEAAASPVTIARYAAYTCAGTFYVGGPGASPAAIEVDWTTVRGLRAGTDAGGPTLVVELGPGRDGAVSQLVLSVAEPGRRYRLQQMLAILYSECHGRARILPDPNAPVSAP